MTSLPVLDTQDVRLGHPRTKGGCDTVDGSGRNVAPDRIITQILAWLVQLDEQPTLFR